MQALAIAPTKMTWVLAALAQLLFKAGVGKARCAPVSLANNVAVVRAETVAPVSAPAALGEHLAFMGRGLKRRQVRPAVEVAVAVAVMGQDEDRMSGLTLGRTYLDQIGMKIDRPGDLAEGSPHLAVFGEEIVVGIDTEKRGAAIRIGAILLSAPRRGWPGQSSPALARHESSAARSKAGSCRPLLPGRIFP